MNAPQTPEQEGISRRHFLGAAAALAGTLMLKGPLGLVEEASAAEYKEAQVTPTLDRVAGENRFGTAVALSKFAYPGAGRNPVLVCGENERCADAFTSAPFAANSNAPVLLTAHDSLDSTTLGELIRLNGNLAAEERGVMIFGGTAAVSTGIENQLRANGLKIARFAGENRYDTAAKVAKQKFIRATWAFVADGTDPATALITSAAAATPIKPGDPPGTPGRSPLLLSNKGAAPIENAQFFSAAKLTHLVAVGDKAIAAYPNATQKISGSEPCDLSVKVAQAFYAGGNNNGYTIALASCMPGGQMDALGGAAFAATWRDNGNLLFTTPDQLHPSVEAFLRTQVGKVSAFTLLGGPNALSPKVEQQVRSIFGIAA